MRVDARKRASKSSMVSIPAELTINVRQCARPEGLNNAFDWLRRYVR